jgi:hypothetical protein
MSLTENPEDFDMVLVVEEEARQMGVEVVETTNGEAALEAGTRSLLNGDGGDLLEEEETRTGEREGLLLLLSSQVEEEGDTDDEGDEEDDDIVTEGMMTKRQRTKQQESPSIQTRDTRE